ARHWKWWSRRSRHWAMLVCRVGRGAARAPREGDRARSWTMIRRPLTEARAAGPVEHGGGGHGVIVERSGVDVRVSPCGNLPRDRGHCPCDVELAASRERIESIMPRMSPTRRRGALAVAGIVLAVTALGCAKAPFRDVI